MGGKGVSVSGIRDLEGGGGLEFWGGGFTAQFISWDGPFVPTNIDFTTG